MINNYQEFKTYLIIESLINESRLTISTRLYNFLHKIDNDKITKALLKIYSNRIDADFSHNYIDMGNTKDEVSFIANNKLDQINNKWKVTRQNKYLTHNKRNNSIFKSLGYTPPPGEPYEPPNGTIGIIKSEAKSNKSDNIYVWFITDDKKETVINKNALIPLIDDNSIWTNNRNNIKIGRIVRSILTKAGIDFTDKDIEDFVNAYKSNYDIMNDAFSKFDLIKGDEIGYWYHQDRYEIRSSTLGNSCMSEVGISFFELYSKNSNCSLLVLYSDIYPHKIVDNKYKGTKIKGRAVVWNTNKGFFMDRIYTNYDSDVKLFIKYAHQNGWWTKREQDSDLTFSITNGVTIEQADLIVDLEESKFDRYPFLDSLGYINFENKKLSNIASNIDADGELNCTDGGYEEF